MYRLWYNKYDIDCFDKFAFFFVIQFWLSFVARCLWRPVIFLIISKARWNRPSSVICFQQEIGRCMSFCRWMGGFDVFCVFKCRQNISLCSPWLNVPILIKEILHQWFRYSCLLFCDTISIIVCSTMESCCWCPFAAINKSMWTWVENVSLTFSDQYQTFGFS